MTSKQKRAIKEASKIIQIGEYVRTNNLRGIKKIDEINENAPMNRYLSFEEYDHNDKVYAIIRADQIVKHSFDIMDLIEVGDYVNGERVTHFSFGHEQYVETTESRYTKYNITSVVTHEQFDKMKFEVNEE